MYIFRILSLLLCASTLHSQVATKTTIQLLTADPIIAIETISAIETRLLYAGYEANIEAGDSSQVFRISTKLEAESITDSTLFYAQLESNELNFWLARRQDDRIIQLLYEDLKAVDGLIMNTPNDPSAIFLSRDPQLLDEQLAGLIRRIEALPHQNYAHLAFSWSQKPMRITDEEKESYMAYVLYAFDTSVSNLSEADMHTVDIKRSSYGEDIHFEFVPDAKDSWLDLTAQAAQDEARAILMILNDEVIDASRFRSTIFSGRGIISGYRNRSQAMEVARRIRIGRLPAEVEIVHTSIIAPQQ